MSSKNVDAPKRPDTKSCSSSDLKMKSGPNRHPKLSAKKSAKSRPDDLRESGVRTGRSYLPSRPSIHGGK